MENQEPIKPQNQQDVNPGSQLDIILNDTDQPSMPETNGTGSNKSVPTTGSVIIESKEEEPSVDEPTNDH